MLGYPLKFTGAICQTMGAIHRVTGQEQFQSSAGQSQCFWSSGIDYHPLFHRRGAGWGRIIFAFYLNKTETTRGRRLALLPDSTEIRDIDVIVQSCPQKLFPWGSSYLLVVNRQRDFFGFDQYSLPLFSPQGRGYFTLGLPC
jgi:hypothetical protein